MTNDQDRIPKTDEFLRKLAMDWLDGRVFTSYRLSDEDIKRAFPILMLMSKDQANEMIGKDVCMIYEYLTEAGPYTVNGLPMFLSANVLTRSETFRLGKLVGSYNRLKKEFMADKPP